MLPVPNFKIINELTKPDGYHAIQIIFTQPIERNPPDAIIYKGKKWYLELKVLFFGPAFENTVTYKLKEKSV